MPTEIKIGLRSSEIGGFKRYHSQGGVPQPDSKRLRKSIPNFIRRLMYTNGGNTKNRYFVIFGGDFVKIRNVKRRNLPFFGEFFVENTVVLAVTVLKTGRKQPETKQTTLNFVIFSDWKISNFKKIRRKKVRIELFFSCLRVYLPFLDYVLVRVSAFLS